MSVAYQAPTEDPKVRPLLKIIMVAVLLLLLNFGGNQLVQRINIQFWPEHENLVITLLFLSVALYVLWMALPFVPGIELGLAIMALLGPKGVVLVYLCTLLSLSMGFALGRLIPLEVFSRFLAWLHLQKARNLIVQIAPLTPEEKLDFLLRNTPSKFLPYLLKHRLLMLAFILNMPGNAIIGGGGGIALIAGMSGLFTFPKYILFVSLAITPLPILFLSGKWLG